MHDLNQIGAAWAEATSADLTGLLDKDIALSGPRIKEGAPDRLLGSKGSVIVTTFTSEGEEGAKLALVTPLGAGLSLAAIQQGKDPGELKGADFEGEVEEAYKNIMDLCVGILGRVFDEEAELPGVSLDGSSVLDLSISGRSPLSSDSYRAARFELTIAEGAAESIELLIPSEIAATWFGPSEASPSEEPEGASLGLIDPDLDDRDEIDELSEDLGRSVVPLDTAEIDDEFFEELSECGALIISWDLAGGAGLDVFEVLRSDPRTESLRVAFSSETPTPAMASAALRWGAVTLLYKPYDAAEIRARLLDAPPSD